MSLFLSDDIAARARANGRTVFDQIKTEDRHRKLAFFAKRRLQVARQIEIVEQDEPQAPDPIETAKRQRWRRSWARMVNLAQAANRANRDILFIATPQDAKVPMLVKDIIREASEKSGIPVNDLKSQRRAKHISRVRHYIFWRCRRDTLRSFPEIGKELGGRDHTTVIHGERRFQQALDKREPWAVMLAGDAR